MSTAKQILLGISGGIAAYKAAELVRRLRDRDARVRVVMTEATTHFITPTTLQALSGEPVRVSLWDAEAEAAMGHIELARWAQLILVAPASADLIARLAAGMADDLITTLCLATTAPLALAPAMNQAMWAHPATVANIEALRQRGVQIWGPDAGAQACGDVGPGRMLEPEALMARIDQALTTADLEGKRFLVSAGPTLEDIDPVRYLGNRSSGRMGFAIADRAARRGAEVTLVAGPVALGTPVGVRRVDVRSALEMAAAVEAQVMAADVFIAAAAVADYRPAVCLEQKHKREGTALDLKLVLNPDILAGVAKRPSRPFLVGFAAETGNLEQNARAKLQRKGIDLIAANRVDLPGQGFDVECNALLLLWPEGSESLPLCDKSSLADRLLDRVKERLMARGARP